MKKIIATLLLVSITVFAQAQKLETKIPNTADVVITANAENIFKLINISELDNSFLGKEMLRKINRKREDKVSSISKAGINIKSNAYYFFKQTDSISYHSILAEIYDAKEYESNLSKWKIKKIKRENGYNYIEGYRDLTIWNDEFLLTIKGDKSHSFFNKHRERLYKLKKKDEKSYSFKKRIIKEWIKKRAFETLNNSPSNSIALNSKFQKGKKKNASASLWVRNYGGMISNLIRSFEGGKYKSMSYFMPQKNNNLFGVEEVTANLFFEKNSARVLLDMSVNSDLKKSFKKIYNKRMNNDLLKGFDHNNVLAFWSMSISTKEILIQYPELINKMYGGLLPKLKEEIDIVGNIFSLIIDEEAIGGLITGDALFVLNDFIKKEVEYTTYKYDEDYKKKEVTKTKETVVPDFTLMIGSKEEKLLNKVLKLAQKYKVLNKANNIYKLDLKDAKLPFDLFTVIKNEVMYVTTSKARAINISAGRNGYNSSKHSNLIKRNSSVLYADINTIVNRIPKNYIGNNENEMVLFSNNNIEDMHFRISKMNGNKISTEIKLNTKGNEDNTLKLLFKFIDSMVK
ncbi:hypothetical protein [Tenacibaculum sp. nBUS_03]|uniref:hypothetical protein n=1 Tax=Tenacibaculum sp. nBUS_03 TaxID=3395320 RepID=UPI003EBFE464